MSLSVVFDSSMFVVITLGFSNAYSLLEWSDIKGGVTDVVDEVLVLAAVGVDCCEYPKVGEQEEDNNGWT